MRATQADAGQLTAFTGVAHHSNNAFSRIVLDAELPMLEVCLIFGGDEIPSTCDPTLYCTMRTQAERGVGGPKAEKAEFSNVWPKIVERTSKEHQEHEKLHT